MLLWTVRMFDPARLLYQKDQDEVACDPAPYSSADLQSLRADPRCSAF